MLKKNSGRGENFCRVLFRPFPRASLRTGQKKSEPKRSPREELEERGMSRAEANAQVVAEHRNEAAAGKNAPPRPARGPSGSGGSPRPTGRLFFWGGTSPTKGHSLRCFCGWQTKCLTKAPRFLGCVLFSHGSKIVWGCFFLGVGTFRGCLQGKPKK